MFHLVRVDRMKKYGGKVFGKLIHKILSILEKRESVFACVQIEDDTVLVP